MSIKLSVTRCIAAFSLVFSTCSCSSPKPTKESIQTQALLDSVHAVTDLSALDLDDRAVYAKHLEELRNRADIVFEAAAQNFEIVKIIRNDAENSPKTLTTPITELQKYFPPNGARHQLDLVVFSGEGRGALTLVKNKPDSSANMKRIINTMHQYGVKNVMFLGTYFDGLLCELVPEWL
ncbi:MAG TPA: hypothetical protein VL527_15115 [Dongiaceae bacterium]|nr:hypothetical protein [Dongiaceae bacterium]